MKKFILSLIFICPVIFLSATEIGVDTDTSDLDALQIAPLLSDNDESDIEGLSHFGTSLFIKKYSDASDRLLAALAENPHSSRILAFLLKNFRSYNVPDYQLKTFIAIAKANPQALPLNVAALGLAGCIKPASESSIDIKQKLAEKCVAENNPDTFNRIQFVLFANIVKTLSDIYLKEKEYVKGDEMFEGLLENKKLFEQNVFLQQAVIFYAQAAEKADKSRRILYLFPSHASRYSERKQELLTLLHARSDKTDDMKKILKHLAFLQKLGLLDEAKDLILEQLAKQPSNPVLQITLAELFSRQKKYALANAIWQKLAKINPESKLFRFNLAQSAFSAQLYQLAADNFDNLLQASHEKNPSVIFMSILSELQLGKPEAAGILLKMLPDTARFAEIRAHVLSVLGKNKEAFKTLSGIISNSSRIPDQKLYFFWLALAVKAESPEVQLKCLKILKDNLDTKDMEVANSIGYTYADLNKNLPEAKEMISYALSKKPESPEYLDSMAWVLFRMKKFKQAAVYIEKAISRDGEYPNAVLADHAGDIFYALGNKQKALHYWNLALKIFSLDLDANKTINKIKDAENK
jgi:tetratricopeptide (TPR) repeat protein